jgi:hypothetical protein
MAYNGTTFDLTATRLTDPATATLTFTSYSLGVFAFTLSSRIYSTIITISSATVQGFNNITCTLPILETDSLSNATVINAGSTSARQIGSSPLTSSSVNFKRGTQMTVNGIIRINNQTITVGGTVVTIIISATCTTNPV